MNAPIKRHSSLVKLSREHQTGLLLSMILKKDTPQYKNMPDTVDNKVVFLKEKYKDELQGHFIEEEAVLFPFVKGRSSEIDILITELISEHRFLENKIKNIDIEEELVSALDEIGCALELHIRKEERQLFQKIQEAFSNEELIVLEEKLKNPRKG